MAEDSKRNDQEHGVSKIGKRVFSIVAIFMVLAAVFVTWLFTSGVSLLG